MVGALATTAAIGLVSLVFSGDLAAYRQQGIGLALFDFLVRHLVRANGITPGIFGACGLVGERLDFEDVQTAEFGDLFEGQRAVIDEPARGCVRHQRVGLVVCHHGISINKGPPKQDGRNMTLI